MIDGLPVILFETEGEWASWLENNGDEPGLWVQIAKKASGITSISYEQAVEVALCFGWIDGLKKAFDSKTWIQRFTARKPNSKWSKINKEKALKLISAGKMRPSGMAAIEIAKKKGTWDTAYDSLKNAEVPEDLKAEFKKYPEAARFFKTLNSVNRYAIIYRLQIARTPEIREKKLSQLVEMLLRNEKIHN